MESQNVVMSSYAKLSLVRESCITGPPTNQLHQLRIVEVRNEEITVWRSTLALRYVYLKMSAQAAVQELGCACDL